MPAIIDSRLNPHDPSFQAQRASMLALLEQVRTHEARAIAASQASAERFAKRGHRLWVANFGVDEPQVPAANWAGYGWSVWQFTSTGRVRGVTGDVDKNRLAVPLRHLDAYRSKPPEPLPEP